MGVLSSHYKRYILAEWLTTVTVARVVEVVVVIRMKERNSDVSRPFLQFCILLAVP